MLHYSSLRAKRTQTPPFLHPLLLPQGAAAQQQVSDFKLGSVWHLLLASYESMRRFGPELAGVCDLLVCDEGHRWVQRLWG